MSNANRSRRQFTTEQKVALLRRRLVDKELVSKICEEAQLQPSVFYQWLRQAFDNLGAALWASGLERSQQAREGARDEESGPTMIPSSTPLARSLTLRRAALYQDAA